MPPRKRAASNAIDEPRRSRRVSSTVKKSNYLEDDDSDDPLADQSSKKSKGTSRPRGKRKTEELDEVSDEYKEDSAAGQDEDEADEEEPEEDQDQNEFATKVTVVKVQSLRPDGGMDYGEDFIHKNTALFLKDLKAHNQREWLKC